MARSTTFALLQCVLLVALLWPKGGYIPADWGAGVALTLLYAAVMLAVMALWARRWRVRAVTPAEAEADPSWMRGPYRFVRHPMHLALLAGALGWCLVYRQPANWGLFVALAAAALIDTRQRDDRLAAAGPRCAEWVTRRRALVPGLY